MGEAIVTKERLAKVHEIIREINAQENKSEVMVDEILFIADNEPCPQTARNRIDARRWIASKWNAKKYSEKIDLSVTQHVDLVGALAAAQSRVVSVCLPSERANVHDVEIVEQNALPTTDTESADAPNQPAEDIFS
jgi:seryl-tRNA synthetase